MLTLFCIFMFKNSSFHIFISVFSVIIGSLFGHQRILILSVYYHHNLKEIIQHRKCFCVNKYVRLVSSGTSGLISSVSAELLSWWWRRSGCFSCCYLPLEVSGGRTQPALTARQGERTLTGFIMTLFLDLLKMKRRRFHILKSEI